MEEEVFIISLYSDEAEASVCNASDNSFLHIRVCDCANSSGNDWRKARSSLLWISAVDLHKVSQPEFFVNRS